MFDAESLRTLFATLDRRDRPEDVVAKIQELPEFHLDRNETAILTRAIRPRRGYGYGGYGYGYSSMTKDFRRVDGMHHQLEVAEAIFQVGDCPEEIDLEGIDTYLDRIEAVIAKQVGKSDFKADRLNKEQRVAAGLGGLSRRRYNKMFRLAARMEDKRKRVGVATEKRDFAQMSKSRLASKITWEEFSKDSNTAAFVAYYTARCNLRSTFTNTAQDRPYDTISDMLFKRCQKSETTNWWAFSFVYPDMEVLNKLNDLQKGELLGRWYGALVRIAKLLEETWNKNDINAQTMIVRKGNDSSTWNVTAGAWNKSRDSWINLLHTLGLQDVLENQCVGKVLRLMAADVARWHRATGGKLEPDTQVWAELPKPWEVLTGRASCTRQEVEVLCRKHGVDPNKKGWIAPKPKGIVHQFKPTPELVHGVSVADPFLAGLFRKWGVFSGKEIKIKDEV